MSTNVNDKSTFTQRPTDEIGVLFDPGPVLPVAEEIGKRMKLIVIRNELFGIMGVVPGLSFVDGIRYLSEQLKGYPSDKIVFFGASGGGYTALLYANWIPVNRVVIITPPSTLLARDLLAMNDTRRASAQMFQDAIPHFDSEQQLERLCDILRWPNKTPIMCYYDAQHRCDPTHVEPLHAHLPNLHVKQMPFRHHCSCAQHINYDELCSPWFIGSQRWE